MSHVAPFLRGGAVLVIRGNVDPAAVDEKAFNKWWTNEHLPERLAIPGFLRARRYFAADVESRQSQYLVCYETQSLETLSSEPYISALDSPTADTRKFMPLLSGWNRSACRVLLSSVRRDFGETSGNGVGASALLLAFDCPEGEEAVRQWICETAWLLLQQSSTPLALHLLEHDDKATGAGIATKCYDDSKVSNSFSGIAGPSKKWLVLAEFSEPPDAPFGEANSAQEKLIHGLKEFGVKEVDGRLYGLICVMYE